MNKSENIAIEEINRRLEILKKYMEDPSLKDYWQRFQDEYTILKENLQNVSEVAKRMVAEEAQEYYENLVAVNGDVDKLPRRVHTEQERYTHLELKHPSVQRLIQQLKKKPGNNAVMDPTVRDEFIQSVYEGEGYTETLPRTSEIFEAYTNLKNRIKNGTLQPDEIPKLEAEIITKALQVGLQISGNTIVPAGQNLISIRVGANKKVGKEEFENIYYDTRTGGQLGIQGLTTSEPTKEEQR